MDPELFIVLQRTLQMITMHVWGLCGAKILQGWCQINISRLRRRRGNAKTKYFLGGCGLNPSLYGTSKIDRSATALHSTASQGLPAP